jgi:hypothetical protein
VWQHRGGNAKASQQQEFYIAQIAQSSQQEAEMFRQTVEQHAERSSNAEIANTQMTQYLDKVTADLAASKAREASHSMEVAVAQTKFEEPCHTGQS